MPAVSVIITNYNGRKYLKDCFDSLRNGSFTDFEIIVVDNGSSDRSVEFLKENYPQVKILELGSNLGLAIASNRGKELAEGKYLFFYNNDTIADKEMLAELVKVMESNLKIGICGCRTLTYDGSEEINRGVHLDILGYPYGEGRFFYVDAAIFIRRDVFEKIGGFDPKLFLYCEDRDLCWRCLLYGYDVVVAEKAVFRHDSFCAIDSQGKLATNIRKRFMGEAFTLRMLLKNYGFLNLNKILPVYLCINMVEILFFALRGQFKIIFCVYLKAHFWNIVNLKNTLKARRGIQFKRKVSDRVIQERMYKGSGKLKLFRDVGVPRFIT